MMKTQCDDPDLDFCPVDVRSENEVFIARMWFAARGWDSQTLLTETNEPICVFGFGPRDRPLGKRLVFRGDPL